MLVFLVLLTNKLDSLDHDQSSQIRYFSVCSPLYLTFFTLIIASFGSKGGNQYWFGLRKPPCQFLFGVCPCLQLFGNISYSLYSNQGNSNSTNPISGGTPSTTSSSTGSSSQELSEITLVYINSENSKKSQKEGPCRRTRLSIGNA